MANKLEGKTAGITGGANGIGLATAKRFVSEGAYVFMIDRNKKDLDKAVSEIGNNVSRGIQCNVSNLEDLDRAFDVVKGEKDLLIYYMQMLALCNLPNWEKSLKNILTNYLILM